MQKQVAELIMNNNQHTPIVLGDMNATLYANDRSSGKCYTSDTMDRNFLKDEGLSPVGAEHDQADPNDDDGPRQWTHQQATSSTDAQGNTTYSHNKIDILMKTNQPCQERPISVHVHQWISKRPYPISYLHSNKHLGRPNQVPSNSEARYKTTKQGVTAPSVCHGPSNICLCYPGPN